MIIRGVRDMSIRGARRERGIIRSVFRSRLNQPRLILLSICPRCAWRNRPLLHKLQAENGRSLAWRNLMTERQCIFIWNGTNYERERERERERVSWSESRVPTIRLEMSSQWRSLRDSIRYKVVFYPRLGLLKRRDGNNKNCIITDNPVRGGSLKASEFWIFFSFQSGNCRSSAPIIGYSTEDTPRRTVIIVRQLPSFLPRFSPRLFPPRLILLPQARKRMHKEAAPQRKRVRERERERERVHTASRVYFQLGTGKNGARELAGSLSSRGRQIRALTGRVTKLRDGLCCEITSGTVIYMNRAACPVDIAPEVQPASPISRSPVRNAVARRALRVWGKSYCFTGPAGVVTWNT